ncbi:uncharacterized protein ARMOST_18422 [Armillaria ostoyae]|uniref:Uncharacterized protein n=1 Tax=Armillaria ostoyae TaxID=47428 RepID=A0A284S1T8_ARMOS|nr:uncharacterized protein ARMOST_18422 [Armillaria ostoyae]
MSRVFLPSVYPRCATQVMFPLCGPSVFRVPYIPGRSLSFNVTLPAVAKPAHGRELPAFAHNSRYYTFVVTDVIWPFRTDVNYWSIICVTDVRTSDFNKAYRSVIINIIQASLLPLEPGDPLLPTIAAVQLAGAENYAYNALYDL